MKILTLTCEYPPVGGGGATAAGQLAIGLAAAGHAVDVVTAGMQDLPRDEVVHGVRIVRAVGRRRERHYSTALEQMSYILPMYAAALRLHREAAYDIVHCHFIVPTGVVAWLLRRRAGLRYVLTAHGSDVPGYNCDRFAVTHRLIAPAWRRVVDSAAAVTSPSAFVARLLHEQGVGGVSILPNPIDGQPDGPATRARRILCAARLVPRKGVQHLIEAMASIDRDWELVIAGDGPMLPQLRQLAQAHDARVRFVGFVPRERLPELYLSSSIFVLPSLQENFPMVLAEAMAAGCAVVTTRSPGCAELVGSAGRLVEPGSAAALAAVLVELTHDPRAVATLGAAGRLAVRRLSPALVAADFASLLAHHAAPPAPRLRQAG